MPHIRHIRKAWTRCLLLLVCAVLPEIAYAQVSLQCDQGKVVDGSLYDTAAVCSGVTSVQNIFTGLVCNFQTLLNSIMGNVYCGIQYSLIEPLRIALVLFVILYGIQLSLGYAQASGGELIMRVLKLSLVWIFATNAAWGIGVAYNFFVMAANQGISWMFSVIPIPAPAAGSLCKIPNFDPLLNVQGRAFAYMDYMLCSSITGPFTANGAKLAAFFAILAWVVPPVFAMFVYFTIQSVKIFIRALFSYLLAMSAIAFLITLSPLFISFALFKPTQKFFEDWLRFMISFTMQIILIFAGVALWITVIMQLTGFFGQLATMLRPIQLTGGAGGLNVPLDTWGVCKFQLLQGDWGPVLSCVDKAIAIGQVCNGKEITAAGQYCPAPLVPLQFLEEPIFLYYLVLNLIAVCTVAYAFDALMLMLPGLARQLAGPSLTVPHIGGGGGPGGINFGGLLSMENSGKQAGAIAGGANRLLNPQRPKPS